MSNCDIVDGEVHVRSVNIETFANQIAAACYGKH